MTNEELILQRLEAMEERLAFLHDRAMGTKDLMDQLAPIGNHAFRLAVTGLEPLNGRVELNDFVDLANKALVTVPKLTWLLDQLENIVDLWRILQPAIPQTWPHIIRYMGEWERNGLFAKLGALKNAGGTVLDACSPEEIEKLGEVFAFLTQLLNKLSDPAVQKTLLAAVDMLTSLDLKSTKPAGIFGMLGTLNSSEGKEGLGIVLELLKSLGKLK